MFQNKPDFLHLQPKKYDNEHFEIELVYDVGDLSWKLLCAERSGRKEVPL
jgi:hypothetical protein